MGHFCWIIFRMNFLRALWIIRTLFAAWRSLVVLKGRRWFFLSQSDWVRFLHSSMLYYAYNSCIMEMMKLCKTFHFQLSLLIFHPSQPLINFCKIGQRRIQLEPDCVLHECQLGIGQLLTESKLFHNNFTPFWSGFSSASGKFLVTKSFT